MKIAFAGKGGVGKTTLCAWMGDYLARQGHDVLLVDADTALSLGQACGMQPGELPMPLCEREDLVRERIGSGMLHLNPNVADLPTELSLDLPVTADSGRTPGSRRLLLMGSIAGAGDGCACAANALLKSLLAHLVLRERSWVLVDLEAGVEHLGRGTVAHVDGLVVVSEPSARSLEVAFRVGAIGRDLGLVRQVLAMNRCTDEAALGLHLGGTTPTVTLPRFPDLGERQLRIASVLGLSSRDAIDACCERMISALGQVACPTATLSTSHAGQA